MEESHICTRPNVSAFRTYLTAPLELVIEYSINISFDGPNCNKY